MVDIMQANENDAELLAQHAAGWIQNSFPELSSQAIASYVKPWTAEKLRERMASNNDLLLVAKHEGNIIGMVSGTAPEGGVGTVIWLLVDEQQRSAGVGKQLFAAACGYYKNIGAHKLKLTAPTEDACKFYEAVGMVREGFHGNHWWGADFWSLGIAL